MTRVGPLSASEWQDLHSSAWKIADEFAAGALKPHLAQDVVVNTATGTVTIDGQNFPWYIAEDGVEIPVYNNELPKIVITLVAERISIVNEPEKKSD